jgi:hypothetical protein
MGHLDALLAESLRWLPVSLCHAGIDYKYNTEHK